MVGLNFDHLPVLSYGGCHVGIVIYELNTAWILEMHAILVFKYCFCNEVAYYSRQGVHIQHIASEWKV